MIRFGPETCRDLPAALEREWLETNGLGGFASSTIAGINTRRYHGLLVGATKPPVGRVVLLSKLEESVTVNGRAYALSANRYPGAVHPEGYEYLTGFSLEPFPTWTWSVEGVEIRKQLFMVHGENTTVVEYDASAPCRLELRPLVAFRDYHSLTRRNDALDPRFGHEPGRLSFQPYPDLPLVYFAHDAGHVDAAGQWYFNFEYDRERERGLDFTEDLFNPFVLTFEGTRATVVASLQPCTAADAGELREREVRRREQTRASAPLSHPLVEQLTAAADQYIVSRGSLETVIAGYPWFSDWGRDTMIALPGLTLTTGRFETAKRVLVAFADSIDRGMLPNRFPDDGEQPEYNTVDATLWFFEAVRAYLAATGDTDFVLDSIYPKLKEIIDHHLSGTRYGIHVDRDGLLACGEPGVQLTWMDARIGDWVVTPRSGKPVEIQALWYNALRILRDLAEQLGDSSVELFLRSLADLAKRSFDALFWNADAGALYDVVNGAERDDSVRPNQVFAVSLYYPILEGERAKSVVEVLRRELLTPLGLRSLSPRHPSYRPRYEGGVYERDSAYHQGTVWPWLIGPFIDAYIKTAEDKLAARESASSWLEGLVDHLGAAGLGHISEVADADPPHRPGGCIAQAWSVAEVLRVAVETVYATPLRARAAASQSE